MIDKLERVKESLELIERKSSRLLPNEENERPHTINSIAKIALAELNEVMERLNSEELVEEIVEKIVDLYCESRTGASLAELAEDITLATLNIIRGKE